MRVTKMTMLSFSDPHIQSRTLNSMSVLVARDIGRGRAGLGALCWVMG